jgi:hypothetical protein
MMGMVTGCSVMGAICHLVHTLRLIGYILYHIL